MPAGSDGSVKMSVPAEGAEVVRVVRGPREMETSEMVKKVNTPCGRTVDGGAGERGRVRGYEGAEGKPHLLRRPPHPPPPHRHHDRTLEV